MMKLLVICLAVLCAAAQADQSTAGLPPPSAKDAHAVGGARNEKSLKVCIVSAQKMAFNAIANVS